VGENEAIRLNKLFPIILYFSIGVLTLAVGLVYINFHQRYHKDEVEREISSIAELKIEELLRWRAERLGDGAIVSSGLNLVVFSQGIPPSGLDEKSRAIVLSRFRALCSAYGYDRIFLMDVSGKTFASYPDEDTPDSVLAASVLKLPGERRVFFLDFYRNSEDGRVYLAILAPVGKTGVLALRIDPTTSLYPFLAQWPTRSETAETLLVRREGDDVVFLNPLRFRADAALSLRFRLSARADLPAAQAVRGERGAFTGRDYRGVIVLSTLRPVPDTPWFLVARMDMREAEASFREGNLIFSLLVLAILTGEILGLLAVTRRQKIKFYKKNVQTTRALYETEERLRKALESSNQELERRVEERNAQLVEANRELEASNSELEAFAYSVAHDLRAPLRAINGFSRILEEDHLKGIDSEGLRVLGVVRGNVQMMDRLISDILELSRLGRMDLNYQRVNMAAMAKDVFCRVALPQALEKFDFKVGTLPDADADASMMERVWSNLLSNAVKYSMPSPIHRVEVEGREEDGWYTYTVRDQGVGFDPRYAGKLFNLFQRLHNTAEFEGTGLGLAIVKKIITRHDGKVWAESNPEGGSRFSFALPARR